MIEDDHFPSPWPLATEHWRYVFTVSTALAYQSPLNYISIRKDEFQSIVKHMVGIMSIPDEAAFGLDMTRVKEVYRLNNHNYDIVRTIQNRESIRGHSTVVYRLKRKEFIILACTHPTYTLRVQDRPRVPKIPQLA